MRIIKNFMERVVRAKKLPQANQLYVEENIEKETGIGFFAVSVGRTLTTL